MTIAKVQGDRLTDPVNQTPVWLRGYPKVWDRKLQVESCSKESGLTAGKLMAEEERDKIPVVDGVDWAHRNGVMTAAAGSMRAGVSWGALQLIAVLQESATVRKGGVTENLTGPDEYLLQCSCGQVVRVEAGRFPGKRAMTWCLQPNCYLAVEMDRRLRVKRERGLGLVGRPVDGQPSMAVDGERLVERPRVQKRMGRPRKYKTDESRSRAFSLYLNEGLMARVGEAAVRVGVSTSQVVTGLLEVWVEGVE